jgi:hypothetical protein
MGMMGQQGFQQQQQQQQSNQELWVETKTTEGKVSNNCVWCA